MIIINNSSKEVVNKDTHNRTTFCEVKVEYQLQNVHEFVRYCKRKGIKALLFNGKLYVNEEEIKSTSLITIVYFVFLFGTSGLLIASLLIYQK